MVKSPAVPWLFPLVYVVAEILWMVKGVENPQLILPEAAQLFEHDVCRTITLIKTVAWSGYIFPQFIGNQLLLLHITLTYPICGGARNDVPEKNAELLTKLSFFFEFFCRHHICSVHTDALAPEVAGLNLARGRD